MEANVAKVYVVQEEMEGGVFGAFITEDKANTFKAACDEARCDDSRVDALEVDIPWQCKPVVGYEVHQVEDGDARSASRALVGQNDDFAVLQEYGRYRGKIFARACRPTEAEARAAVAELITAKRAEIEATP